jgi:hypothetical protein
MEHQEGVHFRNYERLTATHGLPHALARAQRHLTQMLRARGVGEPLDAFCARAPWFVDLCVWLQGHGAAPTTSQQDVNTRFALQPTEDTRGPTPPHPSKESPMDIAPHWTHDERMDAYAQTLDGAAAWLAWEMDLDMPRANDVDDEPYPPGHPLCPEEDSMRDFPLLDLRDAWRDAVRRLTEMYDLADALYAESDHTWTEMVVVQRTVLEAKAALGSLPPGMREGIAQDEADLHAMEARADAGA